MAWCHSASFCGHWRPFTAIGVLSQLDLFMINIMAYINTNISLISIICLKIVQNIHDLICNSFNFFFYFQTMNDSRALKNRVLKYLIPVTIICIVFNITKFFEITVVYIPVNKNNITTLTTGLSMWFYSTI